MLTIHEMPKLENKLYEASQVKIRATLGLHLILKIDQLYNFFDLFSFDLICLKNLEIIEKSKYLGY